MTQSMRQIEHFIGSIVVLVDNSNVLQDIIHVWIINYFSSQLGSTDQTIGQQFGPITAANSGYFD